MSSVSLSSELSNLKEGMGTPEFVASQSEARVILSTSELEAGVRREGSLVGTVSSGCEVCLTHCTPLSNPGSPAPYCKSCLYLHDFP